MNLCQIRTQWTMIQFILIRDESLQVVKGLLEDESVILVCYLLEDGLLERTSLMKSEELNELLCFINEVCFILVWMN